MIYNCEPIREDITVTYDNSVNMSFDIYKEGVLYDMTGMQLDWHFYDKDGTLTYDFTSASGGDITISTHSFNLSQAAVERARGHLKHYLKLTDGSEVYTIWKANWINEL